jgi:hypothetical protein
MQVFSSESANCPSSAAFAGYGSDPVHDAERYNSTLAATQSRQRRHEAALLSEFLRAVQAGELQAPARFAPRITDYSQGAARAFKRHPRVAEVMADALDYPGGPGQHDLLGCVARAAQAGNAEAVTLIRRMATTWAGHQAS